MRTLLAITLLLGAALSLAAAQAPNGAPPVTLTRGPRQARAVPQRQGFTHTGGGNIDVAQPAPDTVVVTLTGVAVAGGHPCKDSAAALVFELTQGLEINADPKVKAVRLTLEGRVIGLLRSTKCGTARQGPVCASVTGGAGPLVSLAMPPHAVAGGESVSVNDREGPEAVVVPPGKYTLHQTFEVAAAHPRSLCGKAASAEFAPDPALDPLWISYWEPFHGAAKKDFGFQVILKVAPEANGN
jgi:hypothetical protein